jgi:hypothetical protein
MADAAPLAAPFPSQRTCLGTRGIVGEAVTAAGDGLSLTRAVIRRSCGTFDKPIIFAFHGYPLLIHRLTYRRTNHDNLHVRGYKEEGSTTTPFDMVVRNELDRFHLVNDVIDRVPGLDSRAAYAKQFVRDKLLEHRAYIVRHGEDLPEIRNWKWTGKTGSDAADPSMPRGHAPSVD